MILQKWFDYEELAQFCEKKRLYEGNENYYDDNDGSSSSASESISLYSGNLDDQVLFNLLQNEFFLSAIFCQVIIKFIDLTICLLF